MLEIAPRELEVRGQGIDRILGADLRERGHPLVPEVRPLARAARAAWVGRRVIPLGREQERAVLVAREVDDAAAAAGAEAELAVARAVVLARDRPGAAALGLVAIRAQEDAPVLDLGGPVRHRPVEGRGDMALSPIGEIRSTP
jgi:hypothetical protein